jgi:hypothetical protein
MTDQELAARNRADHYRELATVLEDRAQALKSGEVRDQLLALAADYRRLASYVQTTEPYRASSFWVGRGDLENSGRFLIMDPERRYFISVPAPDGSLPAPPHDPPRST